MATFDCKACRAAFKRDAGKACKYVCSLPLSSGAKAVLRSHGKRHAADFLDDIRREE